MMTSSDDEGVKPQRLARGQATGVAFLALAVAALPPGPVESDLIRLCDLAKAVALAAEVQAGGQIMSFPEAGKAVVDALLGNGAYAGRAAANLQVFRIYSSRPEALDDRSEELGAYCFESERKKVLLDLIIPLLSGRTIDQIAGGSSLALLRDEGLRAFDLDLFRGVPAQKAIAAAELPATSTDWPPGGKLPRRGDGAGCRALYEQWVQLGGETSGATKRLAGSFNCSPRTIQLRIEAHRNATEPQTKAARAAKSPKSKGGSSRVVATSVWLAGANSAKR